MKVKGEWEGVPGFWIDDDYSPDGKRFVATHYGWEKIKERAKQLSGGRCELNISENCARSTQWGQVHHLHKRKMGGGSRDDRIEINGQRRLVYSCIPCHSQTHNQ